MVTNNIEEYKGVYVFAQQVDNEISGIALELLGKGKELAAKLETEVTAVLIGYNVKNLADKLAEYGADKVILVDDPELETYRTEPYAHALASVIEKYKPEIVLVGATAIGREHHRYHRLPRQQTSDGNRSSRRYAEDRSYRRCKGCNRRVQSRIYSEQQICNHQGSR